jgi:very-short-patch-repair endonuclease
MIPDRLLLAASSSKTLRIIGYRAAAWVYGLDGVPDLMSEFSVPHGSWHRGPYDHQRRRIDDLDIVEFEGVLITSVSQTLVDLCAVVDLDVVERAAESALRMRLVDELALRDFAYLCAFHRWGIPGLVEVLDRRPIGARPTGSDLETRYLQVIRRGGVRTPERQFDVFAPGGELVATSDFGFPPVPFVVETDGHATHKTPAQRQYDLNRQNRINDAGYELRRFTYHDVTRRLRYVVRETQRGLLVATTRPLQSWRLGG